MVKLIQEHWGNSTGNSEISIAHMVRHHWATRIKRHEFDEFTIPHQRKNSLKLIGINNFRSWTKHLIQKGQEFVTATLSKKNEYFSHCLPAFSMDLVNREE